MNNRKHILHLDLDAFYPSVEILDNPALKGRPVIVGGSRQRGVVSSASYEARKYGVHSAQPIAVALRLCPQGIFLPVRMGRYSEMSNRVFRIYHRFTPLVEPLSLDEAFLDVTGSTRLFGTPEAIAGRIKQLVAEETGLTVSAGVASSKLIAKIASDLQKPDGLTVVPPEKVREFLDPLPVEKLWGVGHVTRESLLVLGVKTIGDLSRIAENVLESKFGKQGLQLHCLSLGMDDRDVEPERATKSIGNEETYADDIIDRAMIKKELLGLSIKVARRARSEALSGKTVTLKIKYNDFKQITRSITLPEATDDGDEMFRHCCSLLDKTEAGRKPVRLLGVTLFHLATHTATRQLSLFSEQARSLKKKELNSALDKLSEKYGEHTIVPGSLIEKSRR
ncbi:MAG: DNA polymerase IV [Pseudomonadota bacterium]